MSENARIEVRVPSTVANIGAGFDILGMAIDALYDVVIAEAIDTPEVQIAGISGDAGKLPLDPDKNTAGVSAQHALQLLRQRAGISGGVRLTLHKGLPLSSGLGGSAGSAVGGAVAVNALYGQPVPMDDLLPACLEGEALVSGRHADNVAPALLGGLLLITGIQRSQIYNLPIPPQMIFAYVTPGVAVPTAQARAVLPQQVSLKAMIAQTASVATLMHALYTGNLPLLGAAMEADGIIEPARQHLMPGLLAARAAAKANGALGLVISGAGPTLLALCDSPLAAANVETALRAVYAELNLPCQAGIARPSAQGASWRWL
jgi:homoserine kinase